MKNLLLLILLSLSLTISKAQVIPKDIIERINNSAYIFEGKVIRSNSYFTQDQKMIYTSSTIEIYKIFKGNLSCGTIEVLTRGGCIGDVCLTITDNLVLKKEMIGIFLCSPSQKELPLIDYYSETNPIVLDFPYDIQGYIKYFNDNFNKAIVDYQFSLDSLAQAYNLIELYTQLNYVDCGPAPIIGHQIAQTPVHIPDSNEITFLNARTATDTTLTYTLMNPQITGTSIKYFEFDIGLSDNIDPIYFVSGSIRIRCDSTIFGSMLHQRNKVWVTNIGPLLDTINSYKPATVLDYQRENIWIMLVQRMPPAFSTNYVSLTDTPTPCIHVKIEVLDCTHTGYLTQMLGNWPYLYPQFSLSPSTVPLPSYQTFDYSSSTYFQGCGIVQVSSMRPDTVAGGVGDTVTIRGINFGGRGANSKIFIKNADDGGMTYISLNYSDIKEWNDSLIKFVMPGVVDSIDAQNSGYGVPGSGPIKIQNDALDSAVGSIQVFYSLESIRQDSISKAPDTPYDFTISHQYEGIQFHLDTSIYRHPNRKMCVQKAIKDWVCMAQMRITIIDTMATDSLTASHDTINMIQFGHLAWPKLAETSLHSNLGAPGCDNIYYKTDIIINDTLIPILFCDTNTCDSLPHNLFDLYSILLHEFGHVHGLNHVNDPHAIMYFGINKGQNPYTVSSDRQVWINYDPSAYSGAIKVMDNALNPLLLSCYPGGALVSPLVLSDCEFIHREMYSSNCHSVIGIEELEKDFGLSIYPNPASEQLTIEFKKKSKENIGIEIDDICGKTVMSKTKLSSENMTAIDISMLNQGIYLLKFVSDHCVKGILFVKN